MKTMKYSTLIGVLMFPLICVAQISNGGFNVWAESLPPIITDWQTNRTADFLRYDIINGAEAFEGVHAIKLVPSAFSAWVDCNSHLSKGLLIDANLANKSLYFQTKMIPMDSLQEGVFLSMSLFAFKNGEPGERISEQWTEPIFEWTQMKFDLSPLSDVDSLHLQFIGAAINGAADGCHNLSEIWLDDVRISDSDGTSVGEIDLEERLIYPNPTSGVINVHSMIEDYDRVEVYDVTGRFVESNALTNSELTLKRKGLLTLKFIDSRSQIASVRKVIVH